MELLFQIHPRPSEKQNIIKQDHAGYDPQRNDINVELNIDILKNGNRNGE